MTTVCIYTFWCFYFIFCSSFALKIFLVFFCTLISWELPELFVDGIVLVSLFLSVLCSYGSVGNELRRMMLEILVPSSLLLACSMNNKSSSFVKKLLVESRESLMFSEVQFDLSSAFDSCTRLVEFGFESLRTMLVEFGFDLLEMLKQSGSVNMNSSILILQLLVLWLSCVDKWFFVIMWMLLSFQKCQMVMASLVKLHGMIDISW